METIKYFPLKEHSHKATGTIYIVSPFKEKLQEIVRYIGFSLGQDVSRIKTNDVVLFTSSATKDIFQIVSSNKEDYHIVSLAFIVDTLASISRKSKFPQPERYLDHYNTYFDMVCSFSLF